MLISDLRPIPLVASYHERLADFKIAHDVFTGWAFFFVTEGSFECEYLSRTDSVEPGELLVCPPGVILTKHVTSELDRLHLAWLGSADEPDEELRHVAKELTGDRRLRQLLCEIEDRLDQPLNLDRLAESYGYSKQTLISHIRRATGMTPIEYITALRIDQAKKLLELGGLSVKSVSSCCGFASEYYFSRVFTRKVGVPPSMYRVWFHSKKCANLPV